MSRRYRAERRRAASCAALGAVLAAALVAASPMAFAEESGGLAGKEAAVSDESAFRLGHVAVTCVAADSAEGANGSAAPGAEEAGRAASDGTVRGAALGMGELRERTYRITNQGEMSYIRLASHTLLGSLEHNNGAAVAEQGPQGTEAADEAEEAGEVKPANEAGDDADTDGSEEGGESPSSPAGPLWRFAEDGYWYRAVPLEVGETIMVTVSIEVPLEEEWTAALVADASADVVETLDVQALQARNKAIDFGSSDPWGVGGTELSVWPGASLPEEERGA